MAGSNEYSLEEMSFRTQVSADILAILPEDELQEHFKKTAKRSDPILQSLNKIILGGAMASAVYEYGQSNPNAGALFVLLAICPVISMGLAARETSINKPIADKIQTDVSDIALGALVPKI